MARFDTPKQPKGRISMVGGDESEAQEAIDSARPVSFSSLPSAADGPVGKLTPVITPSGPPAEDQPRGKLSAVQPTEQSTTQPTIQPSPNNEERTVADDYQLALDQVADIENAFTKGEKGAEDNKKALVDSLRSFAGKDFSAPSERREGFDEETLKLKPARSAKATGKVLHGKRAIAAVEAREGPLTAMQRRIVELEGFVPVPYLDSVGVVTIGVGQTGKWMNKSFKEAYQFHVDRVRSKLNNFDDLSPRLQAELIQGDYRGDVGKDHKWVEAIENEEFDEAARLFMINDEYDRLRRKGSPIMKRIEAIESAIKEEGSRV
jgi:hypothetical protein